MDDSRRRGRAADTRGNKRPHKPNAWKRDLLTGKQTREEKKVKASIEILKWKKVTTRMVKFGGSGGGDYLYIVCGIANWDNLRFPNV